MKVTSSQNENQTNGHDAYAPAEIAQRVEKLGIAKTNYPSLTVFILAVLAGAFISMGALFYLFVVSDPTLGFGVTRLLGGLAFSLGLILVIIAGAELFTGNNLIAMAWVSGKISAAAVLKNWLLVYAGNVVGCLISVWLVVMTDLGTMNDGAIAETSLAIASAKCSMSFLAAFARAVLCNALVCIAVWLAMGGHSVTDKILAIIFPVTAFVTIGLEHSIANWFFLPLGYLYQSSGSIQFESMSMNFLATTLGNIIGGTFLVSSVYWLAYIRPSRQKK
ncbi:MAG: formate/nitrite transporter family protein [Crocinitomicaceae bacterium]|nr:formate/nitrite transporter family protein [Crocinitomicaceae bacterium]